MLTEETNFRMKGRAFGVQFPEGHGETDEAFGEYCNIPTTMRKTQDHTQACLRASGHSSCERGIMVQSLGPGPDT